MAGDQGSVDVRNMDEYEWRAWLRSVTPFMDAERVRIKFSEHQPGESFVHGTSWRNSDEWIFLMAKRGNAFSLHCRDDRFRNRTNSFYAVHTEIKKTSSGRSVEIRYWPEIGEIIWRFGIEYGNAIVRHAPDGHDQGLLHDDELNIPAFVVVEDGDRLITGELFSRIQHEINAAWFHEPADLERQAMLDESKKANPEPEKSGRGGRL